MDTIKALNVLYQNLNRIANIDKTDTTKEKWEEIKKVTDNSAQLKETIEFLESNGFYGNAARLDFDYGDLVQIKNTKELVKIVRKVIDVDSLECGYLTTDGNFYEDCELTLVERCTPIYMA